MAAPVHGVSRAGALRWFALLLLCAAYIQGPVTKMLDGPGALAEMEHFGLRPAPLFAAGVIAFELGMSALILIGRWRGFAALALAAFTLAATFVAIRFWEMPQGPARSMAMNAFFEHLGLIGGFLIVALDARSGPAGAAR